MAKKIKVLVFDEERETLRSERYVNIDSRDLETNKSLYPLENTFKYLNESDNYLYYLVNVPIPAKIEAENLKNLRRSTALNNLFNYETSKPFDFMALMPYLIIALLIFFM